MANGLTMTKEDMDKYFQELAKKSGKSGKSEPRISLGQGLEFTTTGTQTASQPISKFYSEMDTRKLTPFEVEQMGGEEEITKRKESAKKLITSETPSTEPLSITGKKKVEAKAAPKIQAEEPKRLWRVMVQDGNASEDTFYDTKEAADAALKKIGGKGAVAGVRFPSKSREEESALKEQYMQRAAIGGAVAMTPKAGETEEERIKRKISEVNPQATEEQKARYLQTLSQSRARGRERGGYAEEYQAASAKGKAPTPYEEQVMAEEARNRRMSSFLARNAAKQIADQKERAFRNEYRYLNKIERLAKKTGQFDVALEANRGIRELSDIIGTNPTNVSARRKLFEEEAMNEVNREIQARDRLRREKLYKQMVSNPEAKSF